MWEIAHNACDESGLQHQRARIGLNLPHPAACHLAAHDLPLSEWDTLWLTY
jgi:hypothetical protein